MLRSPAFDRVTPRRRGTSITEVVVAVPMRNEAARVSACLASLGQAIEALATDSARSGRSAAAVRRAFETPGPVLVDVVTNPDEIALPPKTTASDAWGFAIAKISEGLVSPGDRG